MNKFRCYYFVKTKPDKLFSFDIKARTKIGAIIAATRICKRPLFRGLWQYLTVIKKGND